MTPFQAHPLTMLGPKKTGQVNFWLESERLGVDETPAKELMPVGSDLLRTFPTMLPHHRSVNFAMVSLAERNGVNSSPTLQELLVRRVGPPRK
jgi:hypothetical protein